MTTAHAHIVLVGCGKMGGALLRGWFAKNIGVSYTVIDPAGPPEDLPGSVRHVKNASDAAAELAAANIVVLAIKPQIMGAACRSIRPHIQKDTPVLSIAAGQSLASLAENFEALQPLIRAMPNTPAAIGKGATVAVANQNATPAHKALATDLLAGTGLLEWVEDESLMNAVTALSGSGPAYVFYLIEVLARAGEKSGLPAELAKKLARRTVIGSAALAASEAKTPASVLRENVTSPGGTTEAALKILMNGELEKIFENALAAAKKRGEELNS